MTHITPIVAILVTVLTAVIGATWHLSAKLSRIETALGLLPCKRGERTRDCAHGYAAKAI